MLARAQNSFKAAPAVSVVPLLAPLLLLAVFFGACQAMEPSNKPVDTCVRSCKTRASRSCTEGECMRGCEFILDRLVEKEGDNVIACIARTPRRCTDVVWADCAARIGVHADGGPPGPPPPKEED